MKFRFCGGGDCPDWLLMQINTLSALSIEHLQELSEAVAQALLGTELDYGRIREMAKEAGLDMSEIKACISGLNFILKSGTRHGVAADELSTELEQLGLKSSHVAKLTAIYSERHGPLTAAAAANMLRIAVPQQMNATATGQGVLLNLQAKDYSGRSQQVEFTMTKEQALLMLTELKTVQKRMENLIPE